jgi:transposase
MSCAEAARARGCAPSTATRILARFAAYGEAGLLDRRSENGNRKVDADVLAGIACILDRRAPEYGFTRRTWTLELLGQAVEKVLEIVLSIGHLWKLLCGSGLVGGDPARSWRVRGRPRVACIAQLRRLAAAPVPAEVVLFVDEVDVHLNPRIGPDWMPPGTRRLVITPGNNEKRYLAGAYDPLHQRLVDVAGDRKASWLFLNLLLALLDACRWARTIHLILDNFNIHMSRATQAWLRAHGAKLRLHFLPPYCPDENRIERLSRDLHANVTRNHRCWTMAELMRAVHRYLAARFELAEVVAYAA